MTYRRQYSLWLELTLAIFCLAFSVAEVTAEVNAGNPKTDVKGCWCKYNSTSGQITPRPVIMTAEKEAPSEDGKPEVWVFIVDDLGKYEHKTYKDGTIRPVNILLELFVPADGKWHEVATGSTTRRYQCRVWDQAPAQSAAK